jgi:hypothetical protein
MHRDFCHYCGRRPRELLIIDLLDLALPTVNLSVEPLKSMTCILGTRNTARREDDTVRC